MTGKSPQPPDKAPRKKVRRVRVVEIVDDEDLDEVLDALDAEDEAAESAKPVADGDGDEPDVAVDDSEEPDEVVAPSTGGKAGRDTEPAEAGTPADAGQSLGLRTLLGSSRATTALVVVLIAALASVSIWQWRTASDLSAKDDARKDVAKVAGEYGNSVFTYSAANVQQSIKRNLGLLGGDLLSTYQATTANSLPEFFTKNPKVTMTSAIEKVFVGDVNGDLATAVIMLRVQIKSDQGAQDAPGTLLRLSLSKEKDAWKVTEQRASGQSNNQGAPSQLPGLPGATQTPKPTPKKS